MLTAQNMRHGGIMANYRCTAACRHCMFACSPDWTDGYITRAADGKITGAVAEKVCRLLRKGGCRSIHIGGGEPFLDFEGLLALVRIATGAGVVVEYIETNAFWAADRRKAGQYLRKLARAGADALCISLDPFHAEYVPINMPLSLAGICRDEGFGYFLWQDRFLQAMSKLDRGKTHSRAEMEKLISPTFILDTSRSYGIRMGGRALAVEEEYYSRKPAESVAVSKPCRLLSGGHFHIDLYGRYIPPGCTGIAIPLTEAVNGIPGGKYPVMETLLSGGSSALLQNAANLGFEADPRGYTSGCALCFHIRHWFCDGTQRQPVELESEFYRESMKFI